jgi:transcription elongation factor GreA
VVALANAKRHHGPRAYLRYPARILYNCLGIVPKRKGSPLASRRSPKRRKQPEMIDLAEKIKKKLKDEIAALEHELHDELPKEIKVARAHGDLSENAEYKYAKERQSFVSTRLAQLHQRMADLSMLNLNNLPKDRAAYGSRIVVLDVAKGSEIEYKLVTVEEADAPKGLISTSSPIGRALLGKKVGDEVQVTTPAGIKDYEVIRLATIYDEE